MKKIIGLIILITLISLGVKAQTDHLPPVTSSTVLGARLQNSTDTTNRHLYLTFGGGISNRVPSYLEFLYQLGILNTNLTTSIGNEVTRATIAEATKAHKDTALNKWNNLNDIPNAVTARANIGAASLSQQITNTTNIASNYTAILGKLDTLTSEIWLSKTITSNADISTGSRSLGTDQTTAIQAILNKSSGGKPLKLHWDVKVGVKSLTVYSNTEIITEPGFGAILRDSTNAPMFRNAHKAASGTIIDSNIVFHGGIWNFNRTYQLHDVPTEGFIVGIKMVGIKNLIVEGAQLLNARTFSLLSSNFFNVHIDNCIVDVGGSTINSDGLHFNGTGSNAWITNNNIKSWDDGIAFNADDVLSTYETGGFVAGPISNIHISNNTINNSLYGIRLLSGASRIEGVDINGLLGSTKGYVIIADNYWQLHSTASIAGNGNFGTINISNIDVNIPAKGTNGIKFSYMNFVGNFDAISITNFNRRHFSYVAPMISIDSAYTHIGNFSLTNATAIDTSGINTNAMIAVNSGAIIDNLSLINPYATKTTDLDAPLVLIAGGVVNSLKIINPYTSGILSQVKITSGTLEAVQANGVTHLNSTPASGWINTSVTVPLVQVKGYIGSKISSGSGTITNSTYSDASVYGYINQNRHSIGDWSNGRNEFAGTMNYYKYTPTANDGTNQTFASENIISKEGAFNSFVIGGTSAVSYNYGTGAISNAYGTIGGVGNKNTGVITAANAITALSPTASASNAITTATGLYISPQKITGVTGTGYWLQQTGASDLSSISGQFNSTNLITTSGNLRTTSGLLSAGVTTALAKLHIASTTALATTLNAANRVSIISAQSGTAVSTLQENNFIVRNTAAGNNWTTTTWFNGLSVDDTFITPYTDTKTWFARDAQNGAFSWGNAASTYMSLNPTGLSIGNLTSTAVNKVTITAPTTSATLTLAQGSTLATSGANPITLTSTGATNITLPTTGTLSAVAGTETLTNKTLTIPKLTGYTVDTLPAGTIGMIAYVTDALTPTALTLVVGGGAQVVPVFYNGTQWVVQ